MHWPRLGDMPKFRANRIPVADLPRDWNSSERQGVCSRFVASRIPSSA